MSQDTPPDIGHTIKRLRTEKNLTLDQLAKISGVSKSMLSQIERNKTNPTVATLWSLTQALDIDISDLLGQGLNSDKKKHPISTMKSHQTPEIQSADGKCTLRILGPLDTVSHIEWYAVEVMPGGVLSSEPHAVGTQEHLTVMSGRIVISTDGAENILTEGDTARYNADIHHSIKNISEHPANALLVVYTKQ